MPNTTIVNIARAASFLFKSVCGRMDGVGKSAAVPHMLRMLLFCLHTDMYRSTSVGYCADNSLCQPKSVVVDLHTRR